MRGIISLNRDRQTDRDILYITQFSHFIYIKEFFNKSSQKKYPLVSNVDVVRAKAWFASSKSTTRKSDVHGTWYLVHGTWYLLHGTWYLVHGTWYLVHGTWYLVHEARLNRTSPSPSYSMPSVCGQTNRCRTSRRSVFAVVVFSV